MTCYLVLFSGGGTANLSSLKSPFLYLGFPRAPSAIFILFLCKSYLVFCPLPFIQGLVYFEKVQNKTKNYDSSDYCFPHTFWYKLLAGSSVLFHVLLFKSLNLTPSCFLYHSGFLLNHHQCSCCEIYWSISNP